MERMREVVTKGILHEENGIRRNLIVTVNWLSDLNITNALVHLKRMRASVDDHRLRDELGVVETLLNNRVEQWVILIEKLNGGGKYTKLIEGLHAFKVVMEKGNNEERIIDQAMRLARYLSEARLAVKPRFLPWVNKVLMVLMKRVHYDDDFMIRTIREHEAYFVGSTRVELINP